MSGLTLIRSLRSGNWESYGERCALAKFARDADRPAVRLDDELNDTQTESATGTCARETLINLVKAIEHSLDGSPRQPNSVVLNFQTDQSVVAIRATDNVFIITGVFVRVVQ